MLLRTSAALVLALSLAACSTTQVEVPQRLHIAADDLPPMRVFAPHQAQATQQSNATLARDFLELSFYMESGRPLPRFTRFETPVTVKLTGISAPASIARDLDALIARLRKEGGVNITRVAADQPANIVIETVQRRALKRAVPDAACFTVPNATSWRDFLHRRHGWSLDWASLQTRTQVAIFLPGDVAPQEVRDCLHEELAQALGPINDLYRLPQSVFNDDNIESVLTSFDMMMLRITYAPELHSGMTKAEVRNRLPGILARINPRYGYQPVAPPIDTPRSWVDAIQTAIGPNVPDRRRIDAAQQALAIAQAHQWTDNRMGFSLFVLGRVVLPEDGNLALASLFRAAAIYSASPETQLQAAHVGLQLAAFALSSDDPEAAISIIDRNLAVAKSSENAALLASFLLMKAEALQALKKPKEAALARSEGLGWARYGFGSAQAVEERVAEIHALMPPMLATQGTSS